ncbi:conserved Plasmodium protein, unknown function [Plasmodium chabaudi adami]|uniref:Uncharacterized protein n=1 Tax=Plasmodium chabaudi adami TaxID=5826 RepID=A0A1C6Y8Q7_PLACE|nr:conserved Plasmodium protein, unknown function [Plasmodium chabaudi adami]
MKRKTHSKYDDDDDKKKSDTKKYEQDRRKRLKGDEKHNERRHGRRSSDRKDDKRRGKINDDSMHDDASYNYNDKNNYDNRRSPSYTNRSRSRERTRNRSRERARNRSRGRSRDISPNGKRSGRYNEQNDNFIQSHSGNYSKRNTKKRSLSGASSQSDSHSRRHSKYSNKYGDDKKLINPSKLDNRNYSRNRNYNPSVSNSVSRKGPANYSHNEYQMGDDQNYYEYSSNFRQGSYYDKNGNDPNRSSAHISVSNNRPYDDTMEDDKYNEGNNNKKKKNKHGKNNNNMNTNITNPNHIPIYNNGNPIDGTGYDKITSPNNTINNNAANYMHYNNNMSHPMYMNNTIPNDPNFESNMSVDGNIYNDHMPNPMSSGNKLIPPMNNPNLINQHQPNMMVPPPPSSDGTFYNNMNMPHPNSRKPLVLIPNDNQMKMGSSAPGFVGPPDSIPNHPNMINNMNMSGGMNMPNGFNPMGGDKDMKDLKFENQGLNMGNKNLMNNIPPPPDSDVKKNMIMPPNAPPYNENNLTGPGNMNRFGNNNVRNIVPPPYGNIVDNNMMNPNNKNISNPNYMPLNMQPNMAPNGMNLPNNYLNNTDPMGNPTSNINSNEMNPISGLNMYDDKKYDNPNFVMMQNGEIDGMGMINNMHPSNAMLIKNSANYEEGEREEYDEDDSEQNDHTNLNYQNKPQLTREEKLNEWLETQLNKQTDIVHDAMHLILLISSISKKNNTKIGSNKVSEIDKQKKTHTNRMTHLTNFSDNTVLNHLIENLICSEKSDNFLLKEKLSYKLLQIKNINKEKKNADNAEVNQNLDCDAQEDDNMLEKFREYILSNHRKNNKGIKNGNENDIDHYKLETTNKLNLPTNLDDPFDEFEEDTLENLFEPVQSKETESKKFSIDKSDENNQDDEENKNSFFLNIMKSKLGGTYSIFSKFGNKENIQDEDKAEIENNEEDTLNEPIQNNNNNNSLIDQIKINDHEINQKPFDYKQYLASILINKICKKNNFNYKNILLDELSNISSDSLFFLNNYNITSDDFVNLY